MLKIWGRRTDHGVFESDLEDHHFSTHNFFFHMRHWRVFQRASWMPGLEHSRPRVDESVSQESSGEVTFSEVFYYSYDL